MEEMEEEWSQVDSALQTHRWDDPLLQYCADNSLRINPDLVDVQRRTLEGSSTPHLLSSPEILQLGSNLIQAIGAKKIIDIGTFTGASALAWALVIPPDGTVITMDIKADDYNQFGLPTISKSDVAKKITFKLQPALKTLDELIANGQSGTFDFAFIDADKQNAANYYEKCLQLVRSRGIIAVDHALEHGEVLKSKKSSAAIQTDYLNKKIHSDQRVNCNLITTGDGLMLVFKK